MRRLFTILFPLFCAATLSAQPIGDYSDPELIGVGRLAPRGEINPYASRDEAIADAFGGDYIIPLTEWQSSESADAVTYSTRFKGECQS